MEEDEPKQEKTSEKDNKLHEIEENPDEDVTLTDDIKD